MKKICTALRLLPVAASLITALAACGSYSSGDGKNGGSGKAESSGKAGDDTSSGKGGGGGGTAGSSSGSGGSAGEENGGSSEDYGGGLPCEILTRGGATCVTAHSTVRVIVSGYSGPLYEVCKGTASPGPSSCGGEAKDIASKDGYADAAAQDEFCGDEACSITKIYDQSGQGNDLEPAPKGEVKTTPDNPAKAAALPVTIKGHAAYGILIKPQMGYRTGCNDCNIKTGKGMATGDEPQTMYMVTSQKDLVDVCCFDYGNAETTSHNDGNGTMEAVYFGGGVVWGTGKGGKPGPWVMADLENGTFAGWEDDQNQNISTNIPLKFDFVSAMVIGDTQDKNGGKGRFALYGGDATSGDLITLYDGIRPDKPGYVPMKKRGSLILGTGGDNSSYGGGRFYEGIVANGVVPKAALQALQAAIVEAGYGK